MIKICVPIFGENEEELIEHAKDALDYKPDLIEFRADFYGKKYCLDDLIGVTRKLNEVVGDTSLIFTFRTIDQGGDKSISPIDYEKLLAEVLNNNLADLVDIEYPRLSRIDFSKLSIDTGSNNHQVILSNHLSSLDQINLDLLIDDAIYLNAIIKLAVNIHNAEDLLKLKNIGNYLKTNTKLPLIIIGTGEKGMDTRTNPELYNSNMVFMKRGKGTDPGQIDIASK